ncbi:MAG TPA: hypothetical protein IAC46_02455 [Candidatus Onthoplasma faecigallinarum]|nr:hypothetical protein [Candidatus Onthoplasma faecigallinarum]
MRNIKNSKRYIDYEDLIKLDDEQKILVSRIIINNKFAKMQLFVNAQLSEKFDLSELKKNNRYSFKTMRC